MEGSQIQMMLTRGRHQRYGGNKKGSQKHLSCLRKEHRQSFVSCTQHNEESQDCFTANILFSLSPDYFPVIASAQKPTDWCLPGKPV
jgi:hypothetical protein